MWWSRKSARGQNVEFCKWRVVAFLYYCVLIFRLCWSSNKHSNGRAATAIPHISNQLLPRKLELNVLYPPCFPTIAICSSPCCRPTVPPLLMPKESHTFCLDTLLALYVTTTVSLILPLLFTSPNPYDFSALYGLE